jgi:hypothetical protein
MHATKSRHERHDPIAATAAGSSSMRQLSVQTGTIRCLSPVELEMRTAGKMTMTRSEDGEVEMRDRSEVAQMSRYRAAASITADGA